MKDYKYLRTKIGYQRMPSKIFRITLVILHLLLVSPRIDIASATNVAPRQISAPQSFHTDIFSGRAMYQIPIIVVPGRRNMEPELALSYFSGAPNGPLGLGWHLDMGYIQRSIKEGPPLYDDNADEFSFYVGGVMTKLVRIDSYSNTYRAKFESAFQDFVYEDGYWIVRDKSGTAFRFGYNTDSKLSTSQGVFRWYMDKVVDTHGNFMKLSYQEDTGGEIYLDKIEYTGFQDEDGTEIETAPHSVEFILETQDRPDQIVDYITGERKVSYRRFQAIEVYAGIIDPQSTSISKELVRRYELGYEQSPISFRSLLRTITQYGENGTSAGPLITVNFDYREPQIGWDPNNIWQLPDNQSYFIYQETDTDYYEMGTNLFDVDADGLVDIVRNFKDNSGTYHQYVWLNDKDAGWKKDTAWSDALPDDALFIYKADSETYADYGTRIADINGDGLQDLIRHHVHKLDEKKRRKSNRAEERFRYIWLNNGKGWNEDYEWTAQSFPSGSHFVYQLSDTSYIDAGTRLVDINGDALPDIIRIFKSDFDSSLSVRKVWLNNGVDGWEYDEDWSNFIPDDATIVYQASEYEYYGMGVTLSDVNSDGLIDIIRNRLHSDGSSYRNVWLNTGSGWEEDPNWANSLPSQAPIVYQYDGQTYKDYGVRIFDINADGSSDIVLNRKHNDGRSWRSVWLNTGYGWEYNGDWSNLLPDDTHFVYQYSDSEFFNAGSRIADLDGDGSEDIITGLNKKGTYTSTSMINKCYAPDLLEEIYNGVGADVQIGYLPSTEYTNTGIVYDNPDIGIEYDEDDGISDLPFVVQTVSSITIDDANALTPSYTTNYWYEGGKFSWDNMEFWGFGHITLTDPEGNKSDTYFYQADENGIYKGKARVQEKRDNQNNLYSIVANDWSYHSLYGGRVFFPYLWKKDVFTYDGNEETFKHALIYYDHDDYGNIEEIRNMGDVDTEEDDRITQFRYVYNYDQRILDKHSSTKIIRGNNPDNVNNMVSESIFYYDGSDSQYTGLTIGELTKEKRWLRLPDGSNKYIVTTFSYDGYGNATDIIDPENNHTVITYDEDYHTFPLEIKNDLGHTYQFDYDTATAQVLTVKDPNENVTTNVYDDYGRLKKIYTPLDNSEYPSLEYEYHLDETPMRITTYTRQDYNQPDRLITHSFFDGFGRKIQTRSQAEESGTQVVSDSVAYNWRGQIERQWLPYFEAESVSYIQPTFSNPYSQFEYDALGRQTEIVNPDNNKRTIQYSDWVVTVIDELGHKSVSHYDAHNRLIQVDEYNEGEVYATTYHYDTLDNLIKTIDVQNNETNFTYDSLSLKRSTDDPDMGNWEYEYDDVGNLTKQVDAKAQVINFTYDGLNRLIIKDYKSSQPDVTYYYDGKTYDSGGESIIPNSVGRLSQIVDGSGIITTFYYDELGREIQVTKQIDGTNYTISKKFDALSRIKYITYPDAEEVNYTYNPQGQIESIYNSDFTYIGNADYNASGQLEELYYKNDQSLITDYNYNPKTLRLDKLLTNTDSNTIQSMEYTFDTVGNLETISDYSEDSTNSQSFIYDDLNRITSATNSDTYGTIGYDYDSIGNMIYKNGINYFYEGSGPHQVSSSDDGLSVTYDANGNMLTKNKWIYTYNIENKITSAKEKVTQVEINLKPGWNIFSLPLIPTDASIASILSELNQGEDYSQISTYDTVNNEYQHYINASVNGFSEFEYGKGYFINVVNPEGVTFRVNGEVPENSSITTLEQGWNLIGSPTLSDVKVENLFSQLTFGSDYDQVSRYNPDTGLFENYTNSPEFDDFNSVEKTKGYYIYCPQGASWYIPSDITTTKFSYDSEGGRVKKASAWETIVYTGPYYEVTKATLKRASTARKHIYLGSNRAATVSSDGDVYFYHSDHLGSSNVVTDDSGNVIQRIEYTPFGNISQFLGSDIVRHKFTGQEWDNETGLYYYGARYYDPDLGKFITPDNRVQQPLDPQSLNRIAYARNNPETITDPTGEFWWFFVIIVVTVAATAYVADVIEEAIEDAAEEVADAIKQAAAEIAAAIRDIEITLNINIDLDVILGGSPESSGGTTRTSFSGLTSTIEPSSLILNSPNSALLNPVVTAAGASSDISTAESRKLIGNAARELSAFGLSEQAAVLAATTLVDLSVDNAQIGPTGIKFSFPSGMNSGRTIGSQSGARFSSYSMAQISAKNSVDSFNAAPTLTRFMSRTLPGSNSGISEELFVDQTAISNSLGAGSQRGPSEDTFRVKESANLGTQSLHRINTAFR